MNIFLLLFLVPLSFAQISMKSEAEDFTTRVQKTCKLPLKFNLSDYEYSTDERSVYSNSHFEGCSYLAGALEKACQINPLNLQTLSKVKEVFCMRGSIGTRKIIQRKNGDIVFLIERVPDAKLALDDYLEEELTKVVKLTYEAPKKVEIEKAAAKEKKEPEKPKGISPENRQKKIDDAVAWFKEEVTKLTKNPGPELGPKIEELKKQLEGKLDAINKIP